MSTSESSSPFLPRSASQSPEMHLTGEIQSYNSDTQSGFIKLLDYRPHHPVFFERKHILNNAPCEIGAKVALDIVPIPQAPYRMEGRKVWVFEYDGVLAEAKPISPPKPPKRCVLAEAKPNSPSKPPKKNVSKTMYGEIDRVTDRGFGYIINDDGETVWFHINDTFEITDILQLRRGDRVTYYPSKIRKGSLPEAIDVYPLDLETILARRFSRSSSRTSSYSRSPSPRYRRRSRSRSEKSSESLKKREFSSDSMERFGSKEPTPPSPSLERFAPRSFSTPRRTVEIV